LNVATNLNRFGENRARAHRVDKIQVKGFGMTGELMAERGHSQFSEKEVVTALYRSLLGRMPDAAGFDLHIRSLRDKGLVHTLDEFVKSPEFGNRLVTPPSSVALAQKPAMNVQIQLSPEDKSKLWAHVSRVWNSLGETELYYSVLTSPKYRAEQIQQPNRIESFYETAGNDMAYFDAFLERNGIVLSAKTVVAEFGCGVGRVTRLLARRFSKVLAFDVSASHLRAASERIKAENINNVEFIMLAEPSGLNRLRDFDLFFSIIVLQHNPPPIVADILEHACRGLNPEGIAFFQVPTYALDYTFDSENYFEGTYKRVEMEMHFIPQREIFEIFQKSKMVPLEVLQDGWVGNYDRWISNTFLVRKRA
jgi:SAM-dependent methyltransferase